MKYLILYFASGNQIKAFQDPHRSIVTQYWANGLVGKGIALHGATLDVHFLRRGANSITVEQDFSSLANSPVNTKRNVTRETWIRFSDDTACYKGYDITRTFLTKLLSNLYSYTFLK